MSISALREEAAAAFDATLGPDAIEWPGAILVPAPAPVIVPAPRFSGPVDKRFERRGPPAPAPDEAFSSLDNIQFAVNDPVVLR